MRAELEAALEAVPRRRTGATVYCSELWTMRRTVAVDSVARSGGAGDCRRRDAALRLNPPDALFSGRSLTWRGGSARAGSSSGTSAPGMGYRRNRDAAARCLAVGAIDDGRKRTGAARSFHAVMQSRRINQTLIFAHTSEPNISATASTGFESSTKNSGRHGSFQVGAHKFNEILGKFWGDLLFGAIHEVETDMGFENLTH